MSLMSRILCMTGVLQKSVAVPGSSFCLLCFCCDAGCSDSFAPAVFSVTQRLQVGKNSFSFLRFAPHAALDFIPASKESTLCQVRLPLCVCHVGSDHLETKGINQPSFPKKNRVYGVEATLIHRTYDLHGIFHEDNVTPVT